jgi:hypothetical protein
MILARKPFGKLPCIAENSLVGPTRPYYLTPDLVRRDCGPRSQEAFQRHWLIWLFTHGECSTGIVVVARVKNCTQFDAVGS